MNKAEAAWVERLRQICLALPEANERLSHGEPAFFIRDKRQFVSVDDHHHGADHLAFWCAAPLGAQEQLIAQDPNQFFRPPYVGHRGWLGVRMTRDTDWQEISELVVDAYRHVAPASLVARIEP